MQQIMKGSVLLISLTFNLPLSLLEYGFRLGLFFLMCSVGYLTKTVEEKLKFFYKPLNFSGSFIPIVNKYFRHAIT